MRLNKVLLLLLLVCINLMDDDASTSDREKKSTQKSELVKLCLDIKLYTSTSSLPDRENQKTWKL